MAKKDKKPETTGLQVGLHNYFEYVVTRLNYLEKKVNEFTVQLNQITDILLKAHGKKRVIKTKIPAKKKRK